MSPESVNYSPGTALFVMSLACSNRCSLQLFNSAARIPRHCGSATQNIDLDRSNPLSSPSLLQAKWLILEPCSFEAVIVTRISNSPTMWRYMERLDHSTAGVIRPPLGIAYIFYQCYQLRCEACVCIPLPAATSFIRNRITGFYRHTGRARPAPSEKRAGKSTGVFVHYTFAQSSLADKLFIKICVHSGDIVRGDWWLYFPKDQVFPRN